MAALNAVAVLDAPFADAVGEAATVLTVLVVQGSLTLLGALLGGFCPTRTSPR